MILGPQYLHAICLCQVWQINSFFYTNFLSVKSLAQYVINFCNDISFVFL